MDSKNEMNQDSKQSLLPSASQIRRRHDDDDEIPPEYFDSEPSSQPPNYQKPHISQPSHPGTPTASSSRTTHRHHNSASANTVAAILASPYIDLDAQRRADRKKKSLRERWKDFRERNLVYDFDPNQESGGSARDWNVMGAKPSGGMQTANRKR